MSSNQSLGRIITKVEKKSDNSICPVNPYTSDEQIHIVVANNDRLKRDIPMTRLDPRRIKPENLILPVALLVIKESSDNDYSRLSPTIKC